MPASLDANTATHEPQGSKTSAQPQIASQTPLDIEHAAEQQCIDHAGDVRVKDQVHDGARLRCAGTLRVDGQIGAATLDVGGDLFAPGGVRGRPGTAATITVGGSLRSKYLESVEAEVNARLEIETQATGSTITVHGVVDSPNAAFIGGLLRATRRVHVATLGSSAGTTTRVVFGEAFRLAPLLEELEALAAQVDARRDASKKKLNLLSQPGRILSSAEKEEQTGLSFEVFTLEGKSAECALAVQSVASKIHELVEPEIRVEKALNQGVVIQSHRVALKVRHTLRGPLRITSDPKGAIIVYRGEQAPPEPLARYAETVPVSREAQQR